MINSIRLQNFRSYRDGSFEFEPGVNIIVGPNAAGKTNLLEAVMVLARGSSYKAKDSEMIRHGAKWSRLDGFFNNHTRVFKLQPTVENQAKTFEINSKIYRRLSNELNLPIVFFEPNHLQLISRGPEFRRDFIDDILARTQPGFKRLAGAYRRALAQRNALLKRGHRQASQQLFAWNIRLAEMGSQIAAARAGLVKKINKRLPSAYSQIAGTKTRAKIVYQPTFPVEEYAGRMVRQLEKNSRLDMERGFTSVGPHREDFVFFINNQPAASTASRGEARSLLLALKALELNFIEEVANQKPLFLLDDVSSELDGQRRRALVQLLKDRQSLLTTTDADTVLDYFAQGNHKLIALN